MADRLHIGCGTNILNGWVNLDSAPIEGVEVVHDLTSFPWPFASNRFDEILAVHVLEHLADTVKTLEEIHRICKANAKVTICVPYWNSRDMASDPTHIRFFSEYTFDFFDPSKPYGSRRAYYSSARFRVASIDLFVQLKGSDIKVSSRWKKKILTFLARHFCGVIWAMEVQLVALK